MVGQIDDHPGLQDGRAWASSTFLDDIRRLWMWFTTDQWVQPRELLIRTMGEAGRGRGITRMEGTPLDIWLLTDIKVEELEPVHARLWEEFTCNADAQMLARGVWLSSHADAAMNYPDLFKSANAVRKQRGSRRANGPSSIKNLL